MIARLRRTFLFATVLGWLLAGCSSPFTTAVPLVSTDGLVAAYQAAIDDARLAEPAEVSHQLVAITPHHRALRWRGLPGRGEVLVTTWTSWHGYDALVGQSTVLSREVWVTVSPQVRDRVAAQALPDGLTMRLAQLLGLPPTTTKDRFVDFWVRPADLFRPAANPDITTPSAQPEPVAVGLLPAIPDAHQRWFTATKAASYGAGGYPWTRLGYTYDWGNRLSEEGLSEFVIRAGATVEVARAVGNEAYCQ